MRHDIFCIGTAFEYYLLVYWVSLAVSDIVDYKRDHLSFYYSFYLYNKIFNNNSRNWRMKICNCHIHAYPL